MANKNKVEVQLELDLDKEFLGVVEMEAPTEEKTHNITFTESEVNTISLLCAFVQNDKVVESIQEKLSQVEDKPFVEEMFDSVVLKQYCVEEDSFKLGTEVLSLYNNGYVLEILD